MTEFSNQYDNNRLAFLFGEKQKEQFQENPDPARAFIYRSLPQDLSGCRLLDLGCGEGTDLQYYESKGAKTYGVDSAQAMVRLAQEKVRDTAYVQCRDMEDEIPIDSHSLDFVTARFSLHYLPQFEGLYGEIARLLKPDGLFVFVVDHPFAAVLRTQSKSYGKQEQITIGLYDGELSVTFFTHTLADYLSAAFLRDFSLEELYEYRGSDVQEPSTTPVEFIIPNALGIKARRR